MYGNRFWDDQNKKIIRCRNVTFNENMSYKDKTAKSANENKQSKQVSLEEISKSGVVNRRQNLKVEPESEPKQIAESINHEVLIRRSSRTIVAPQMYFP